MRKTERASSDGGQGLPPSAHSTTPGHSDPVSTTSGVGRRGKGVCVCVCACECDSCPRIWQKGTLSSYPPFLLLGELPKERRGHRQHQAELDLDEVVLIDPEQDTDVIPTLR